VFYQAAGGGEPVHKEIEKCGLTVTEMAKVQTAMNRVAEGRAQPGDVKTLRGGVLEVRVSVAQRRLRLIYAESQGGLVLLALHFFQKQRQVETRHIDVAVDRLRDFRSRQP
jgi:phage-related protein